MASKCVDRSPHQELNVTSLMSQSLVCLVSMPADGLGGILASSKLLKPQLVCELSTRGVYLLLRVLLSVRSFAFSSLRTHWLLKSTSHAFTGLNIQIVRANRQRYLPWSGW
jgi:hypothetical protein